MIARRPYYEAGGLSDHLEFFDEVGRLARTSDTMRIIRRELLMCLPGRWRALRRWKSPHRTINTVRTALHLYLPGLSGNSSG
jgi:hypothetical protein